MEAALTHGARLPRAPWITLGLLGAAAAWDATGWDMALAQLAGGAQGFPWRDHWLPASLLHVGARAAAWLLVLGLTLAVWWPPRSLRRLPSRRRVQLVASALLAAAAVALLKSGTTTSCPWDLAEFGGVAQHVSHWSRLADGGPGRCFPAGHASSGFILFGGYFAWRGTDARVARLWLLAAGAAGLVLGLAQQWRGAHFMSHTLWTAAVCWCVAVAVDAGFGRVRKVAA
ncbi:MAG: phosphatase PAP2 family protein [Ramlibacter sp.]